MSGCYGYVLFHTSAAAFRAEKASRESCASASDTLSGARLVPTPQSLDSALGGGTSLAPDSVSDADAQDPREAFSALHAAAPAWHST